MSFRTPIVIAVLLITTSFFPAAAQNGSLVISGNVRLPQDSVTKQLMAALNGFLAQKEKPNKENSGVLKEELLETSALLDEMKGIEQNAGEKEANFYKPYLINVVKQGADGFAIQLSYMGVSDGAPLTKASFTILARKAGGQFFFYSPLKQNTSAWKTKKSGYITFKFKGTLNAADAKAFKKNVAFLDKKLRSTKLIVHYYCANFLEAQQLLGVNYKSDYVGVASNNFKIIPL
jgi:hypothetical protein